MYSTFGSSRFPVMSVVSSSRRSAPAFFAAVLGAAASLCAAAGFALSAGRDAELALAAGAVAEGALAAGAGAAAVVSTPGSSCSGRGMGDGADGDGVATGAL